MRARTAAIVLCLAGQLVTAPLILAAPATARGGGGGGGGGGGVTPPPPTVTDPPAPALSAPAAGATVVQPFSFSWAPSQGSKPIVAYVWQISTSSTFATLVRQGNPVRPSDTAPAPTTAAISGLPNGVYFWRVNATSEQLVPGSGLSTGPFSAGRSFTVTGAGTGTLPAPNMTGPPDQFQYHPFEFVRISWDPVPGAHHYLLEYDNEPTFSLPLFNADFSPIPATETTSPIMFGEPVGNLWFRVVAVAADGTRSLPSNVRRASVTFTAPGPAFAPLLVGPPDGTVTQLPVTLDWADDANPQSYELQIGRDPNFTQANAAECTGVDWCVRGIPESKWEVPSLGVGKVYWRVRSEHGDKSPTEPVLSAWSAVRSFTVAQTPPTILGFDIDVMTDNGLTVRSHTTTWSGTTADNQVFGRLTLNNVLPAQGQPVTLTSSDPSVASVPSSITVPAGCCLDATGILASFPIEPKQVTTAKTVTITATLPTGSISVPLTVNPPSIKWLRVTSSVDTVDLSGGDRPAGLVVINGAVPSGGATVTFTSSRPDLIPVPSAVSIPAGGSSGAFTLATNAVSTATPVTVTASWGSSTVSLVVTLHPAPTLLLPANGASFASGSAVKFDWSDELSADQIQVSTSPTFATTVLDSFLFGTSVLTTSSLPVGTLFWRARAFDKDSVAGPWSATRTVVITGTGGGTGGTTTLTAPVQTLPIVGARFNVGGLETFDWTAVEGAASYDLQVDTSSSFTVPLSLSRNFPSPGFTTASLAAATYSWRVRAVDSAGNPGPWSSTRSFRVG